MILCWFAGDLFKTTYYIYTKSPAQLIICSFFLLTVDTLILIQIWMYKQNKNSKPIIADDMVMSADQNLDRIDENSRLASYE